MRVLVTGAAGFIGFHVARALLARGDAVVGLRHRQRLLRPGAEGGAAGRARPRRRGDRRDLALPARRPRRPARRSTAAFADARVRPGDPPRRPGRGALQPREPARLRRVEPPRLHPRPRGLPPRAVRRISTFASTSSVYGGNTTLPFTEGAGRRPPAAVLRRDQARERADGACLRPPLPPALHRLALLHRLRALGPARHGADALRRGDPRRAGRSSSSTTAGTAATSPMSTTSSRG